MNDALHADMSDLTLAERLGNHAVIRYEVNGITTYDDIRRLQEYCDAQGRVVRWTHNRNGGSAVIHVDTSQGVLDFGDAL